MQKPIRINMKVIENRATGIFKTENTVANYGDLLVAVINRPMAKAMDLKSMRRDLKLLDLFEEGGESFEVSNEDFKHLSHLVETSEWAVKHRDIVSFADYIDSLKD